MYSWLSESELWLTLVTMSLILGLLIFKPGSRKKVLYKESIKKKLQLVNGETQPHKVVSLENSMIKVAGQWLLNEKSRQPLSVYQSFENSLTSWIRGYPSLNLLQQLEVLRLYMEARRAASTAGRSWELRLPSHLGKVNLRFPWKVIIPLLNYLIASADKGSNLILEIEEDVHSIHIYLKDGGESYDKGQNAGIVIPDKYSIEGMQEALVHFDTFYGANGQREWLCNRSGEYTLHLKLSKNMAIQ